MVVSVRAAGFEWKDGKCLQRNSLHTFVNRVMAKRGWDFDPTRSDPEDEDFDVSADRKVRHPKRSRPAKSTSRRKRQKTERYGSEDISDDEELDSDEEVLDTAESSEDEEELNEATGRPVRRSAAKKQITYDESSEEGSIDYMNRVNEESSTGRRIKARQHSTTTSKQSLIVKFSLPAAGTRRNTRARSNSIVSKNGGGNAAGAARTRRSGRLAQDDADALLALTTSGNHSEVVRNATTSPEPANARRTRGGKGLKKPPSAIMEVDDDDTQHNAQVTAPDHRSAREDSEDDDLPRTQEEHIEVSATQTPMVEADMSADQAVVPESSPEDDDEDEDDVVTNKRRVKRRSSISGVDEELDSNNIEASGGRALRSLRARQSAGRKGIDDTSDFEPEPAKASDEDMSQSEAEPSPMKAVQDDSSNGARRSQRRRRPAGRGSSVSVGHESEDAAEVEEELQELRSGRSKRRTERPGLDDRPRTRTRKPVDYRILRPETNLMLEDDGGPPTASPSKRRGGGAGGWSRSLFSVYGPFGGAGGPPPVFGGAPGAAGGADSDSSDDDGLVRPRIGPTTALTAATPTAAAPPGFGAFPPAQTHSADPLQASLGKVKDKQALADADPLGVDQNVKFDGVGGLEGHIDQLKEMVMLPLLYPEVFQRFKITPPRGVLFHGPPGTGKTLMARALASSVSQQGQKVTFYMRKGADALSKWVGEAERQLRLLFEEARKNQPSIIFFDEIDGLAPVRSSKQEQIHASIVSTLLALMDGMDGRGQVIVIGATNRPDSVDPALRRPGRFDREFYFPLPNQISRRAIIDIHTKGWEPPPSIDLKDQLAAATKGYGGADLRALCTEAALNSVQRTYPQIYKSTEKRLIKPETIQVSAKDFMLSLEKIVPSSQRSASSGAAPLPKVIAPLLSMALQEVTKLIGDILPQKAKRTALQEAEFEDPSDDLGLTREIMQQELERARVYRPRLLVRGQDGMGQQYLAAAILNQFEGVHVQSFDLPTLLGDSTRSAEAAIVQLFTEAKRHKPSVIYLPAADIWYQTVGQAAISTFLALLQTLSPTDPVLVLGVIEGDNWQDDVGSQSHMIRRLFGYSSKNQYTITRPSRQARQEFFAPIGQYLETSPPDFPDPEARKKRVFEDLPLAPIVNTDAPKELTKEELKFQKRKDRQTLNILKLRIQPIMDQIRQKYKKFRTPVIEESQIRYLFEEQDPINLVTTDLPLEQQQQSQFRPFERSSDAKGEPGLLETATNKFFYNMETVTIEKRLSNGYYKRPKDFLSDIKKLTRDAKTADDQERFLKANELQANVEVDLDHIETQEPAFAAECEALYHRERKLSQAGAKATKSAVTVTMPPPPPTTASRLAEEDAEMTGTQEVHHENAHLDPDSFQASQQSILSNGTADLDRLPGEPRDVLTSSELSNGLKVSSSDESASTHLGLQTGSFEQSAQTRSIFHSTGPQLTTDQRFQAGHLAQRGAITPLAEGSNPAMYHNSASTTSSEKRNTNSSADKATQSTGGQMETQDDNFRFPVEGLENQPLGGSQLPDTQSSPQDSLHSSQAGTQNTIPQSTQSQSQPSQPSQPPAVPKFPSTTMHISKLVNGDLPGAPTLRKDVQLNQNFLSDLVGKTSGCSVEQLEQVNSVLMDHVWRTRGSWDRVRVVNDAGSILDELLEDMGTLQGFGKSSMENGM